MDDYSTTDQASAYAQTKDSLTPRDATKSLTLLHKWVRGFFITYAVGYGMTGVASLWFALSVPPDYDVEYDLIPSDWMMIF